ncbi:exonuclease domain-containing protein, partial [Desulfobacula sp.]|uniref:exonuclease domain-containing protein n=1 Tax=Desulfobacula sp. TaxID=2593537 RepID=UPI001E118FDB|nr:hypothetical protein [Desulfobacula sp.]
MKTFLFYDVETSGLNPAFDQILTFACIRTDPGLNEIKRQTITIRLRKDIVPSPQAFLTHGLTFDELSCGINEYEAALKIHKILNTPDTISLGYNSLGFDDDFLRFLFYRNLLDPYTHQYANGCSRMDILPITVLFRIFQKDSLNWPHIDGKPSLKLDLISRENNFVTTGRAHEALNDVEAVIELSKKMFFQKDIWNYSLDFFNKTRDEIRINNINKTLNIQNTPFRHCIMMSASFGSKSNYMAQVIHLGSSLAYKNQSLWLRLDSDDILGINAGLDIKETFVLRKKAADALIVLPALERFLDKLSEESRQTVRENIMKIGSHKENFFKFIQYHLNYKYPFIPDMDPDAALYQDGFFSFKEKQEINLFHQTFSNLASLLQCFELGKKYGEDLIYFVEDDYLHFESMLEEMIASYERIASQLNRDIFMCPADYPYLYMNNEKTNILVGNKRHWRTINKSLCTFLTTQSLLNKYW